MRELPSDERGVEPLAMKIFAGIVLLMIGLGIGYAVYTWAGKGTQQMLSFTVNVSPGTVTIEIPENGVNMKNISVTITRIGTYDETVSLDAEGEPTGVNVSFSPASGKPDFGSTMTITVDNSAIAGVTTITIKATGADDTQKSATLELTLE